MQHPAHPDDERLAALAGDDSEATSDARLAEHVAGCQRCTGIVADLRQLRSSLAELPDLRPSRPILLLPPVPVAGSAEGGAFGWLRRLAAPAMVAGAGLALVGAVGFGGTLLGGMASGAGALPDAMVEERNDGDSFESVSQAPAAAEDPSAPPAPADNDDRDGREQEAAVAAIDLSSPTPWVLLLGAGVALLLAGLALRFTTQPRAG